jgi:hypothetical protein
VARSDEGLDDVRRRLAARVDDCWERLEDAIAELTTLHGVGREEIMARVHAALDLELER